MRDRETIDSELRLLAAKRRLIRDQGGQPSYQQADELLDERLAHRGRVGEDAGPAIYPQAPATIAEKISRRSVVGC